MDQKAYALAYMFKIEERKKLFFEEVFSKILLNASMKEKIDILNKMQKDKREGFIQ